MRPPTCLPVLAVAACLGGCASRPVVPDDLDREWTVSTLAPIGLPDAYPLNAAERVYCIDDGPDAGGTLRREFIQREDGLTELRETLVDTGETVAIVVLSRNAQGDVVVHETGRPRRDLLTRFDPPMLFAPALLSPGETVTQTLRVTTHPLSDPSRVRDRGEGTHELSRGPDRVLVSGADSVFATLTSTLRLRLGIASVESVSGYSLDAGASPGLRDRSARRTVRVFGIVADSEREVIR